MSTRSAIGKLNDDGTVTAIYCHFNGDLDHNGRILAQHYTDKAKIDQLLDLGDISSLAPEIGTQHPFNQRLENEVTAYGRDRSEENVESKKHASINEFKTARHEYGAEYMYLFTDSGWMVAKYDNAFEMLSDALERN